MKWHPSYDDPPTVWPVPNHLFWDSDVAKWIEGACYFLHEQQDEVVESAVHELVEMIQKAQQEDGYSNIHFVAVAPNKRFTNLHELQVQFSAYSADANSCRYNARHLIEAVLAHNQYFQTNELLRPIVKSVNLLCKNFGPGEKKHAYPGHPDIELALLRLYAVTKKIWWLA